MIEDCQKTFNKMSANIAKKLGNNTPQWKEDGGKFETIREKGSLPNEEENYLQNSDGKISLMQKNISLDQNIIFFSHY